MDYVEPRSPIACARADEKGEGQSFEHRFIWYDTKVQFVDDQGSMVS